MSFTKVPKPVSTSYTNTNVMGKQQYDDALITYDDPTVYYDGVNPFQWTDVAKPENFGNTFWMDATLPWASVTMPWGSSDWTKVLKPS